MAIECITGVPGAGKSYFAANILKKEYEKKKRLIYTNINLKVDYDEYLKFLDVDVLYDFAKKEYELFLNFEKLSAKYLKEHTDDDIIEIKKDDEENQEYIEYSNDSLDSEPEIKDKVFDKNDVSQYIGNYDQYLKDSGLLNDIQGSLIVWDECHEKLQGVAGMAGSLKADTVWIRFFSYHRHFDVDIYLITQDITLIHRRYKPFISKYYFGQNPAKRLMTTTLKYKVYTDSKQFDKFYIETINLPMKKEIHDFYDSGEYKPSKSVILKKILPAIVLIVVAFAAFYFLFESNKSTKTIVKTIDKNVSYRDINHTVYTNRNYDNDIDIEESNHIVFFTCNLNNCTMKNSSFVVPLDSMNDLADAIGMEILYTSKVNRYYSLVAVSVSESLFNDLMRFDLSKRGDKHEKGRMDFRSRIHK